MSEREFIAFILTVLLLLLCAWVYQNQNKIKAFYIMNYAYIWFGVFSVFWALVQVVKKKYVTKTRHIYDRYKELSRRWCMDKAQTSVFVGKTHDGVSQYVSEADRSGHVQIIGATGRGKTQSVIIPWAVQDHQRGRDVIIIDGKGSHDLAYHFDNPLVFDLSDKKKASAYINPLESGTAQEITDRIFSSFEFKDPYYKSIQYDITLSLITMIKHKLGVVTFKTLHEALTNKQALQAKYFVDEFHCGIKTSVIEFIKDKDFKNKVSGLVSQLAPLAIGEISHLVNGRVYSESVGKIRQMVNEKMDKCTNLAEYMVYDKALRDNNFNKAVKLLGIKELNYDEKRSYLSFENVLVNCSKKPKAVVVLLPTLKYQKTASLLGKLICQQIAWCVGQRENKGYKEFTPIFMDEFSSFVYEGFYQMLNKARSSGVSLHLAHQALSDLEVVSKDFAKSINTNTNVKCILGVNDPDTAEFYARHLGTKKSTKITEKFEEDDIDTFRKRYSYRDHKGVDTSIGSIREVESYKVHPNDLKCFSGGEGVLHLPSSEGPITEKLQFFGGSYAPLEMYKKDKAYDESA